MARRRDNGDDELEYDSEDKDNDTFHGDEIDYDNEDNGYKQCLRVSYCLQVDGD